MKPPHFSTLILYSRFPVMPKAPVAEDLMIQTHIRVGDDTVKCIANEFFTSRSPLPAGFLLSRTRCPPYSCQKFMQVPPVSAVGERSGPTPDCHIDCRCPKAKLPSQGMLLAGPLFLLVCLHGPSVVCLLQWIGIAYNLVLLCLPTK